MTCPHSWNKLKWKYIGAVISLVAFPACENLCYLIRSSYDKVSSKYHGKTVSTITDVTTTYKSSSTSC